MKSLRTGTPNIIEISQSDKAYPKLLKEISNSPKRLYCRGNLDLLNSECFAVVGSRAITPYGQEAINKIVPSLARHFTIVSGMALGIDAAAQRSTINAGGKTIAVLGTAVENPSPRSNVMLANDILKHDGLLISEFSSKDKIFPANFAIRDRIITGLSKGVLIVEADIKSGSLVSSRMAVEQNRDVFAVPGSIFSARTAGPHFLIKKGAKLVENADDIVEEYAMLDLRPSKEIQKLTGLEDKIYDILKNGAVTTDALIESVGHDTSAIMVALTKMELKGLIRQLDNGKYINV